MCSGKISYFHEVVTNPFYLDGNRIGLPSDFYLTDALTENALAFLKEAHANPERREKPFFLYLAHIAPHWPLHAREAEVAAHRARYRQLGWNACQVQRIQRLEHEGLFPAGIKPASWPAEIHGWPQETLKDWQAERMAVHAAMVSALDRSAGKIIAQLSETGLLDNTLILFLSDNGAAPDGGLKPVSQMLGFAPSIAAGAKFRVDGVPIRPGSGPENLPGPPDTFQAFGPAWARVANTPYRDTKLSGYEGGIRTPLIAHWPRGIVSPGRIVPDLGHVMDLMPTFLELAGAPYPVEWDARRPLPLDGISLTPVFRAQPCASRSALFWQVPLHRVVRDPQWKAVASNSSGKWELYDLQSDPGETTNLAEKHPEILRGLSEKWASWAASHALK
jgi:arylsulfatase